MFPKLERKFVFLYTLSTGLILTLILAVAFLFFLSSQDSRMKSHFQDQIFTVTSRLQTDSLFSDSYLAQMENKNRLLIYIEENNAPLFFPGSYTPRTEREELFSRAENMAGAEGIFQDSHPISSNLLQSSILKVKGDSGDIYFGNIVIVHTGGGYKKLILLQDITENRLRVIQASLFYLVIDIAGILLLFLTGRRFVRRSLKPLEETYVKQQDFVAAASHELRSPLAVIQTAADAAAAAPGEAGRLLNVIKKECLRGSSLVKNLLLLVSADQNNWAVKKTFFELDEMLLSLLEVYEPLFISKGGQLLLSLPGTPLSPVSADPELCRQIFTILLDNAAAYGLEGCDGSCTSGQDVCDDARISAPDACDDAQISAPDACDDARISASEGCDGVCASAPGQKKRQVTLRAEYTRSHTTVYVIDHGPGIPDEDKDLVFDRFYRGDKSRNKKEHFGLGLSIAAKLAQIQGIGLSVEDTEGGGSTFVVRI